MSVSVWMPCVRKFEFEIKYQIQLGHFMCVCVCECMCEIEHCTLKCDCNCNESTGFRKWWRFLARWKESHIDYTMIRYGCFFSWFGCKKSHAIFRCASWGNILSWISFESGFLYTYVCMCVSLVWHIYASCQYENALGNESKSIWINANVMCACPFFYSISCHLSYPFFRLFVVFGPKLICVIISALSIRQHFYMCIEMTW